MKYSFPTFYSLLVLLLAFSLASMPVNAQGEDEELDDDEEDEELLDDDEEEGEEEGLGEKGELSLGESGEEESEGMIGGTQLSPPSFFSKPGVQGADVKDDKEGEGKKKEEKEKKEPEKDVKKEPGWLDKTTKFLEITGYFRFRSDLFYRFDMGFPSDNPNLPFGRPYEARYSPQVETNYSDELSACGYEGDTPSWCGKQLLMGANIRLRVEPVISLSEMVKIKAQLDILDNLQLGSTPEGYSSQPGSGGLEATTAINPWVPLIAFTGTQVPPSWRNSLSNPISVRTAWGEVMLKNIGLLKFGRMPSGWGLGLLANDGSCPKCDYGDIADRVLFATKLFGTIFAAGWDFPASGPVSSTFNDTTTGQNWSVSLQDDVWQWLGVIAYKLNKEEEERKLAAGSPVISAGLYYLYRQQNLSAYESGTASPGTDPSVTRLVERDAWAHIGDVWFKFLMGDFRAELEVVLIGGKIGNLGFGSYDGDAYNVLQWGGVLQLEYMFLNDALIIGFEAGYASGDSNIEGLTPKQGLLTQEEGDGDDWITAFRFDPDYNVDLILFEEILGQVAASYYFKPSVTYWFVKNHFFGTLDIIYSRASEFMSTNGNDANLGVEFDITLAYKTRDRFTGMLQYGYLIPLDGWKDLAGVSSAYRDLDHPMTFQVMMAIDY